MEASLALVVLAVADVEASKAFYIAAFGWDVAVDLPVYVQFRLPAGASLSLFGHERFEQLTHQPPLACPPSGITATELYLSVDDLEHAAERLIAAGARELSAPAPRDWGDHVGYYADPDGNVIAIHVASPAC